MIQTTNLKLNKLEPSDPSNWMSPNNQNLDAIDNAYGKQSEKLERTISSYTATTATTNAKIAQIETDVADLTNDIIQTEDKANGNSDKIALIQQQIKALQDSDNSMNQKVADLTPQMKEYNNMEATVTGVDVLGNFLLAKLTFTNDIPIIEHLTANIVFYIKGDSDYANVSFNALAIDTTNNLLNDLWALIPNESVSASTLNIDLVVVQGYIF